MIKLAIRIFDIGLKGTDKHTNSHRHNLQVPLSYFLIRRPLKVLNT